MKRRRRERPWYVTLLAVLLFLGAVGDLLLLCVAIYEPETLLPVVLSRWVYPTAALLSVVCGTFMLVGRNFARWLFLTAYPALCIWVDICVVIVYPLSIPYIVFRSIFLVAFCIALTMEGANYFFTGRSTFFKRNAGGNTFEPRKSSRGGYDY